MKIKTTKLLVIIIVLLSLLTFKPSAFTVTLRMILCGLSIILSSLLICSKKNKIFEFKTSILSYILLIVFGFLSFIWAKYSIAVNEQLLNMTSAILVNVSLIIYVYYSDDSIENLSKWLFPIFLIYFLQSFIVGYFDSSGRFSPNGAVNQFGIIATYIYMLSLYIFKYGKKNKIISLILIVISVVFTFISGSRKALINLLLFTIAILLFKNNDKNLFKKISKIFLILLFATISFFAVMKVNKLYDVVGYRIESLISYYNGEEKADMSALRRKYMKEDAIVFFKKHPIIGIGLNNFKYMARYGTYSHSNYYEMLSCLGIIGFVLYYLPVVFGLIVSVKNWKKNYESSIISFSFFLSMFITEFSNISYMYRYIHVFIGIFLGLTYAIRKKQMSN